MMPAMRLPVRADAGRADEAPVDPASGRDNFAVLRAVAMDIAQAYSAERVCAADVLPN